MARHAARWRIDVLRTAPVQWMVDAGRRAAWTALAALLPLVPGLVAGTQDPQWAAGFVGLTAAASLLTAVVSLPESVGAHLPPSVAVLLRGARQAAQAALAAIATSVVLQDVPWLEVWQLVAASAAVTLVRALAVVLLPGMALPETTAPTR